MRTLLPAVILILFSQMVLAAGTELPSKYFSKQKTYSEGLYVLNDFLEFSVFDMSKLGLFVNAEKVDLSSVAAPQDAVPAAETLPVTQRTASESEKEIKAILSEIPKFFYKNLKNQIYRNKVPVTLYAKDSPPFANPLKLYVKLKKISLGQTYVDKKGRTLQPVAVKIYGQLKEKKTDKLLTRFYDTETIEFAVGAGEASAAMNVVSDKMMQDLALYMKSMY